MLVLYDPPTMYEDNDEYEKGCQRVTSVSNDTCSIAVMKTKIIKLRYFQSADFVAAPFLWNNDRAQLTDFQVMSVVTNAIINVAPRVEPDFLGFIKPYNLVVNFESSRPNDCIM